jgi:uncharacterized protein
MQTRKLTEQPTPTWIVVLDTGDEAVACLTEFGRNEQITAAQLTALGAFSSAVLGFFDFDTKDYHRIEIGEQVEVATMVGDFAVKGDEVHLHPHAVLSTRDGRALGGHLLEARVRPTLEVVVTQSPGHLRRRSDPETGLALIDASALE